MDGALCAYWNRKAHIEFLLHLFECGNDDNKLEDSLFCLLGSTEFIGVMRAMSIIAVRITNPLRWLAGKTYELAEYGWSARHMSRSYDDLESSLIEIIDDPSLFLKEDCMKKIFKRQIEQVEPFKEFLQCKFDTQTKRCVKDNNGVVNKIRSYQVIIKELFEPEDETNIATAAFMNEISKRLLGAFLKELRDPKKSIYNNLSSMNGARSWAKASEADIENSKNIAAVNDACESTFGALTDEIKRHQNIGLTYAGGVAMSRKNGDFATGWKKLNKDGNCIFNALVILSNLLYFRIPGQRNHSHTRS